MLGLKLIHVSKRGHWCRCRYFVMDLLCLMASMILVKVASCKVSSPAKTQHWPVPTYCLNPFKIPNRMKSESYCSVFSQGDAFWNAVSEMLTVIFRSQSLKGLIFRKWILKCCILCHVITCTIDDTVDWIHKTKSHWNVNESIKTFIKNAFEIYHLYQVDQFVHHSTCQAKCYVNCSTRSIT